MDRRINENISAQSMFSMDAETIQSPAVGNPYAVITQVINVKDQKQMENEAYITHLKKSIGELVSAKNKMNDEVSKLKADNQVLENDVGVYNSNESRKSLKEKSDILMTLKWQLENIQAKLEKQMNVYKTTYNEFYEKYKETKRVYEDYHPMYKEYKQIKTDKLRLEVELKMLQAKVIEQKKKNKLRHDIQQKMFYVTCVKIAKFMLEYRETQIVKSLLKEETERHVKLLQELQEIELLAAEKKAEIQGGGSYLQISEFSNVNSMTNQLSNLYDADNTNSVIRDIQSPSSFMFQKNIFTLDSTLKSEENLRNIRSRCGQRQQQWLQRQVTLSGRSIPFKNTMYGLKRPMTCDNSSRLQDTSKIFKTLPKPTNTQNIIANPQVMHQNSKVNVISVHNISSNRDPVANQKSSLPLAPHCDNRIINQMQSNIASQNSVMQKFDHLSSQPCASQMYQGSQSSQVTTKEVPLKMPIPVSLAHNSQLLSNVSMSMAQDSSRFFLPNPESVLQPQQLPAQDHFFMNSQYHSNTVEPALSQNQMNKNNEAFKRLVTPAAHKSNAAMAGDASISPYFNVADANNQTSTVTGTTVEESSAANLMSHFLGNREYNPDENFEFGSNVSFNADCPSPMPYDENDSQAEGQVSSLPRDLNFGAGSQAKPFFRFDLGGNDGSQMFNMF